MVTTAAASAASHSEGGRYVQQYNGAEPIHPFNNTPDHPLPGRQPHEIGERNYVDLKWREQINTSYTVYTQLTPHRRIVQHKRITTGSITKKTHT